jgi:archaellum component FlaC
MRISKREYKKKLNNLENEFKKASIVHIKALKHAKEASIKLTMLEGKIKELKALYKNSLPG